MWLELNSLVSSSSISAIFEKVPRLECRVFVIRSDDTSIEELRRLPYRLYRYSLEHLIAHYVREVNGYYHVYIVSSSEKPFRSFVEELNKRKIALSEEKALSEQEIRRFIRRNGHILAESYLRLALRGYLLQRGYSLRYVGKRAFWNKSNSNHLYIIDVDVDPETLEGYISVDFRLYSTSSIWDKIVNGNLSIETLQELKDSLVLVPYGNKYAYGRVAGFLEKKVSEDIEVKGGKLNLLKYYAEKRHVNLDPNEYPVVMVKLISPKQDEPLHYPPSQVRLLISDKKPEPHTRYEEIDGVLKEISSGFKPFDITFKRVLIKKKGYVDMIRDIELRYHGGFISYKSPLRSVQRDNATPLRGKVIIPVLVFLLPRKFYGRQREIEAVAKLIQVLFASYNMGEIRNTKIEYYEEKPSVDEQKIELSRVIGRLTSAYSPEQAVIMPVIGDRDLFSVIKQRCSERYFHARVVKENTLVKILDFVAKYLARTSPGKLDESVREFVDELKREGLLVDENEFLKQFISNLSNIVFSIYIEFIIQSEIFNKRIPHTLTWSLAKPADGEGRTFYLGFDVSRSPQDRSGIAVMFLLYDSYGNMVNAAVKRHAGERLSRELLENILLSLIAHGVREERVNRLVIYKDGFIRGIDEARELLEVLQSIGSKAGLREFDVVGVVKRHDLRLFLEKVSRTDREALRVVNPKRGTWVKLWSVSRHGVVAERALVVSSEARAGGTVKPVVVEHYKISKSGKGIEDIVNEYLRLCRLDFWNPLDGINKYPLPVFMADELAYLSLLGVEVKTS